MTRELAKEIEAAKKPVETQQTPEQFLLHLEVQIFFRNLNRREKNSCAVLEGLYASH